MWTVVFWVECSVLQWTVCGRYSIAGGHRYCGLNVVCYSEQYVEVPVQQVDSGIVNWMECVTVNSCGRYSKGGGQWYCGLNVVCYSKQYVEVTAQHVDSGIVGWMVCVTVNIMWKVLHSRWTVVLCIECSVLQWTVCGRYCTEGGQWYCGLNVLCYSEHYVEGTAQQVDSGIVYWMECVTGTSMW